MNKLHIFIETSISEEKKKGTKYTNEYYFIEQYLHFLYPDITTEDYSITGVGGKDNLKNYDNIMKQNTTSGEYNIVIFDCDDPTTGGGFDNRTKQLNDLKSEYGVDFDFFLFPNNKDNGAFENLLLNIINPKHNGLIDCFDKYEMCIGGQDTSGDLYETPNCKAKIYSYITSFKRSRKEREKIKSGNWDFQNEKYWNLKSDYLLPLKDFIESAEKRNQ